MVRRRKRPQALPRLSANPHGSTTRIDYEDFPSDVLHHRRRVTVLLPPGYDHCKDHYPVFYLQDGQNLFEDHEAAFGVSWRAGITTEKLILAQRIMPIILVGIGNTPARLEEYAPHGENSQGLHYCRFVLDEVKPFVDAHYRTLPDRKNTAIGGSSMGGLISLYLAWHFSERVSLAAVMSPSLWWADTRILTELSGSQPWMKKVRFWVDAGTREGHRRGHVPPTVQHTRELIDRFDANGLVPGHHYYYWEVAGGEHNEAAWAARFDKVLLFLFGR